MNRRLSAVCRDVTSLSINVVSSARRLIFMVWFPMFIPLMLVLLLIAIANISTVIIKGNADKGHPCLIPFERAKNADKN